MLGYVTRRILVMIPTLIVISALVFVIIQLPPGDYFTTYMNELQSQGEAVDPAKLEFIKQQYGFDKPMIEQYFVWLIGMLHGDFGLFTWIVAFPIGVYSAVRQYSLGDYTLTFFGFLGLATPNFLLALVLQYAAYIWFDTSIGGLMDPKFIDQGWSLDKTLSILEHLWVPVIVIGTSGTAGMIRRLRANLLDELHKQYVITALAKGLRPGKALVKYPLRMALNPFIADIGNLLPEVISGAAIVSIVLSLPTTGPMLLNALQSQDMYLAGSFLMFLATLTVIGTLLSDLALGMLDPRIRLGGGASK